MQVHQSRQILLENKRRVYRGFRCTFCPDEHYKQTVFYNEILGGKPFRFYLNHDDGAHTTNMRLIDWERGKPYCFTIDDFDEIEHSSAMFCRKICDEFLAAKIYEPYKNEY